MIYTLADSQLTQDLLFFAICFLSFVVVSAIIFLISKHISIISSIFLVLLICAIVNFAHYKIDFTKIDERYALSVLTVFEFMEIPFTVIYSSLTNLICSLFRHFNSGDKIESVVKFLSNPIFYLSFQGLLFLLCLLIFRPRRKRKNSPSQYDD